MKDPSSPSSSFKDSAIAARTRAVAEVVTPPDAAVSRDAKGHFTQAFRLAALRYALACGKTRQQAALDMGISSKSLSDWSKDAKPASAGEIDVQRFDELARLRADNRELLARNQRLIQERDFLKKAAAYFATPTPPNGGSK